jgi:hypothetical protein
MEKLLALFMEKLRLNGVEITIEGLLAFVQLFTEHFGEISDDDVDELCHFVEKNFNTQKIDVEHVKAYFAGFE